jgi:hypothetical protein
MHGASCRHLEVKSDDLQWAVSLEVNDRIQGQYFCSQGDESEVNAQPSSCARKTERGNAKSG